MKKILIIDDEKDIRILLFSILKEEGYIEDFEIYEMRVI